MASPCVLKDVRIVQMKGKIIRIEPIINTRCTQNLARER